MGADKTTLRHFGNFLGTIAQRIKFPCRALTLLYGMTGSFSGLILAAFQMSAEVYKPFVSKILQGLV